MALSQDLAAVTVNGQNDVGRAAAEFRAAVELIAPLRIGASDDIATGIPMTDGVGNVLAVSVFGWMEAREQWWKKERFSLASPLSAACRYEANPFWADKHGFHTVVSNPYLDEINLANFERRAMTSAAIVVPIHLPFGRIGAVCLNERTRNTGIAAIFEEHGEYFGSLARRFVTTYAASLGQSSTIPTSCKLSCREVECLEWAAAGKTDLEIAAILSKSRSTVRFHFERLSEKLNTVNRSQAVYKALQLGYVCPDRLGNKH